MSHPILLFRPVVAAVVSLVVSATPCLGLVTINLSTGGLRDAGGTAITDTPTLWAIIYDDDDDGLLPGNLASEDSDSLVAGDAEDAWSAFAGKTIAEGTMIGGDRIIKVAEFDSPFAVVSLVLEFDLASQGLVSTRPYGLYWFPGRSLASNSIPASGSFDIGGIYEITDFTGTLGTTIPSDGAGENTGLLEPDFGGSLPITRFYAIPATEPAAPDFADWIEDYPAVGSEDGFDDDPDDDGLDNGVEAALGTRPDTANPGITLLSTAGDVTTVKSSKAKPALADVTAVWQWSDNLVDWYPSGSNGSETVIIDETVTDSSDPDFDLTEVDAEVTVGQLDRLFLRLSVNQTP